MEFGKGRGCPNPQSLFASSQKKFGLSCVSAPVEEAKMTEPAVKPPISEAVRPSVEVEIQAGAADAPLDIKR